MAPKKLIDQLRVSRQSPLHADPEEGNYNDAENNPPLIRQGELSPTFDHIVASPSDKRKSPASSSATNYEHSEAAARDSFILEKHAVQVEQLH